MNVKTTVILVVLLVICVGYVAFFHSGWFGRDQQPQPVPESRKLVEKVGKIVRLSLETPHVGKVVLARKDDKWRLVEPLEAPAAKWEVSSTVTTVADMEYTRKYAPDQADCPKDNLTHLSAPLRIVSFTDDKGKTYTLKVGQKALSATKTYVQLEGDGHVYVVDRDLAGAFDKTASDYREKNVVEFETDKVVRVEVRGEQSYGLVKADGKWGIDIPVAAPADEEKVKSLLKDISGLRAEKFVDEVPKDLAAYGLDKPLLEVTVELAPPPEPQTEPAATQATKPAKPKKGEVISVAFGAMGDRKEELVFAKLAGKPWLFLVKESKLKDLQPKLSDLRDKTVMDIGTREVTRIEITPDQAPPTTLEKIDNDWHVRKPFAGASDEAAVIELIEAVRDLKASEFQDNPASFAAYGLAPPRGKILLHFRGSDKTAALLLGSSSTSGEMGFVRPEGGKSVAVVDSAEFAKLLKGPDAYWSRKVLELPDDAEVRQVTLTRPDGGFTVERADGDEFRLTSPVAAPADKDNVKDLFDALKQVKAQEIVALGKGLPPRFAKAKPKPIRVTITYRVPLPPPPPATQPTTATAPATGPTTSTAPATKPAREYRTHKAGPLLVMKDKEHAYVWDPGRKPLAVGKLGEDLYEKLSAELRDRNVLKVSADEVGAFKLVVDQLSMEFKKRGEEWSYTGDRHVKVDSDKVKSFLESLEFKAKKFVDYGDKPHLEGFGLDKPFATLEVTGAKGKVLRLGMSRTGPVATSDRYAMCGQVPGVFVLTEDGVDKLRKKLKDFQK